MKLLKYKQKYKILGHQNINSNEKKGHGLRGNTIGAQKTTALKKKKKLLNGGNNWIHQN